MTDKLVLLWKGTEKGSIVHSQCKYPLSSLAKLKTGLERYGAEIVGACDPDAIPLNAVHWRLGDPGSDYFYGQSFRGDLGALVDAVEQVRRNGGKVVRAT